MINRQDIEQALAALETPQPQLEAEVRETLQVVLRQQLALLEEKEAASSALHGERKLVTVMFADISGFTAMSEKLDPEEVRSMINLCFEGLGEVIDRYDGHIDKFIGDEIMALFGAPTAHENDPERALRAALDMMDTLKKFNAENAHKIPKPLSLHFGINTGLVIAGGIGTSHRRDYSVMGDTVNLAARLEDLSEAGEILVGEDTYRMAAPLFEFDALEPVKVKGKAKPVRVFRLLRAKESLGGQLRGVEGLISPMVGRAEALTQLQQLLDNIYETPGGLVSITGEAGLGKSRLISELYEGHDFGDTVYWVKTRALSHAENASYHVIRQVLRKIIDLDIDLPPEEAQQQLEKEINTLCLKNKSEIFPYLLHLLDLPLTDEAAQRVRYLDGELLRRRTIDAIREYILAKVDSIPLIILLDDLHWADPSSLEVLESLLPLTQQNRLMLMLVYRPRRDSRIWGFYQRMQETMGDHHIMLELTPLDYEQSFELLNNLLGYCQVPQKIQDLIVTKAEGNPFFVEEVIRSLIDSGDLTRADDDRGWVISPGVEDITIPDTLQGVVMARIDRLDYETKHILQVASVIGRNFSYDLLDHVVASLNGEGHIADE